MRPLRTFPIQRKLRLVILITCSAALVVACGTLFGLQFFFFRRDFERDLKATAEIIAANSTAAIAFRDEENAHEILGALRAKPHITGAAIVLLDGTTFAQVGDAALPAHFPGGSPAAGLRTSGGDWVFTHPIRLDSELLGMLVLHPDYHTQSRELFRLYAVILLVVLTVSFLVAVFISWRLERLILDPIHSLAEVAGKIGFESDYSIRAEVSTDDEIGTFTESFNGMLDQIESRDRALRHQIAERQRAEEELHRVHQQLMDASRQAGMAEVATGVLHNVGNVLNSVNVSTTLLSEKLGNARTGNLVRAAEMLRGQNGNLATFLTDDPRGRLLPDYLVDVSAHLASEQQAALGELALLTHNVEHIKEIVAMQQNYARLGGLMENLPLADLIEDALRMNAGGFERHGVVIRREIADVPLAAVDKHKVLQILVNLMRNAKYALDEGAPADKQLTVRLEQGDSATLIIQVEDNGIGVVPENLVRIFSHGFTTRPFGHGFGLHSAALAAQQMNGRLRVHSEGAGRGATFTLELPVAGTVNASALSPLPQKSTA